MDRFKTIYAIIPQIVIIMMLLWALNPGNPYAYYVIMRVIACAGYTYLCVASIRSKQTDWAWVLGVLAFVYNPFMPLHLNRGIWSVINVVSILITAYLIWSRKG